MTDFLVGGSAWWAIPAVALTFGVVFGFFPGFTLRLIILLYPGDDPRRRELVAELYVLGRMERIEWVFQQLETALFEGVSARLERRGGREKNADAAVKTVESDRANHDGAVDWVKFFDEDDVYSVIGSLHATLTQEHGTDHAAYNSPPPKATAPYRTEVAPRSGR